MEKMICSTLKLSHKKFRALLKKFRRKKIRQNLAKEREQQETLEQQKRENSPGYKEREEEIRRHSEIYDQFEERERIRQHKVWLWREQQAQEEFKRKQEKIEFQRVKDEEERKRILQELEKQVFIESQNQAEVTKIKLQKEEALQEALSNLSEGDGPWHNPIAPENYNAGQERDQCMFFSKTGCCRFGDRCSRGHTRPAVSCTILIRGMYCHFSIDQTGRDDYDTDIALEYEDKECYQDFKNFYYDVLPEFKKFGKVVQFKVCNNFEPHLRGNVYVQYSREEEAIEAYKNFNGRYYASKQITCEFTHVIRWRAAICGLRSRNLCPKGINCNFLHVFKNPNDEFWEANRDLPPTENRYRSDSSRKRYDKSNYHSSENKHRHESRSDRYESRNNKHEYRYDSRNDRYESRSERYDSRKDRYESRSERYASKSERHESRSEKYESGYDREESKKSSKTNNYNVKKNNRSDSSSNSNDDDDGSSRSKEIMNNGESNSRPKKRLRDLSPRSRSNSPYSPGTSHQKKKSHKSRKHKKKKSKKHKKQEPHSGNSTDDNSN